MNNQSAAQLWLKPGCLRRHNLATVSNVHNLLHSNWMQGQCHLHLATIYTTLQLAESAKTAHEVDTLIRTQILDAQNIIQNQTGRDIYIEHADRILIIIGSRLGKQAVPLAVQINEECLILTTLAEAGEEINEARARDALERARRRLREADARLDAKRAEAAIARAEARLKAKLSQQ